jgi:hypothetical protein
LSLRLAAKLQVEKWDADFPERHTQVRENRNKLRRV